MYDDNNFSDIVYWADGVKDRANRIKEDAEAKMTSGELMDEACYLKYLEEATRLTTYLGIMTCKIREMRKYQKKREEQESETDTVLSEDKEEKEVLQ